MLIQSIVFHSKFHNQLARLITANYFDMISVYVLVYWSPNDPWWIRNYGCHTLSTVRRFGKQPAFPPPPTESALVPGTANKMKPTRLRIVTTTSPSGPPTSLLLVADYYGNQQKFSLWLCVWHEYGFSHFVRFPTIYAVYNRCKNIFI